jgi:dTDP-3-amino-3,4,6-trideoxy-alpha-D-glucose transaminase
VSAPPLPFLDLRGGDDAPAVQAAIERVLASARFVLGPELEAFETEFAAASRASHAIGVGSGTDAIALLLRAADIGPGDEVLVPALTAAFTGLAVMMTGARPVFVDIDPVRLTMGPGACAAAVTSRTRAIVPVHLYGQPADLDAHLSIATRHSLALVEDCCQAHLATCAGIPVGTRGFGGAFSFYPTKNLGALGDSGAVTTGDPAIADRIRRLRNGGQSGRYEHVEPGVNSRLDELQAAVLRERLRFLPSWTAKRRALAAVYRRHVPAGTIVPEIDPGHVYHLFPIRSHDRDALAAHLRAVGVETLIHYPVPLHEQPAFAGLAPALCPNASQVAREVLSLPLHPRLQEADVARVAEAVAAFQKGRSLA